MYIRPSRMQAFREFYPQVREMHKQGLLELDWEDPRTNRNRYWRMHKS